MEVSARGKLGLTGILGACGVFMGLLGPFGTASEGWIIRMGYWLSVTYGVGIWFWIFYDWLFRYAPAGWYVGWYQRVCWAFGAPFLVGVFGVPTVWAVGWAYGLEVWEEGIFLEEVWGLWWRFWVASGVVSLWPLHYVATRRGVVAGGDDVGEEGGDEERASQRAYEALKGLGAKEAVAAVGAEDHYVRYWGLDGGSVLASGRMRDVLERLSGVDGISPHRSWWVSRDAVEGAAREGGRWVLKLRGGLRAPVARERASALRAGGWLAKSGGD